MGAFPSQTRSEAAGLVRDRLLSRFRDPASFAAGVVVAPAGWGKSRLLAQTGSVFPGPVAWCGSPDPIPRLEPALVEWLWSGLPDPAMAGGPPPERANEALARFDSPGDPVLFVVDDAHLLEGSAAEIALDNLLAGLVGRPSTRLRIVLASRVDLAFDLSRLRVADRLVEIGSEDLRFRAWEVEDLFRDVYGDPMVPEETASLARRTGGWAAYLQLFHLATQRKSPVERRRVLDSLGSRSGLVQEYLARHVLAGLSDEMQDFLIRTSVLRRPTGQLCDELLGRSGSDRMLEELERRRLFTDRIDDSSFRYHALLVSYLDARLIDSLGVDASRLEHGRAAVILEREGFHEDAAAAYARAEDWDGVARNLGRGGRPETHLRAAWLDALPPTVVEGDALLLLARARRSLASGALAEAAQVLRQAQSVAASSAVAEHCRDERDRIAMWMTDERPTASDWVALLRKATQRAPLEVMSAAASWPGPEAGLVQGMAAFLAGDMPLAASRLRRVAADPDFDPALGAFSRLVASGALLIGGRAPAFDDVVRMRDEVEAAGVPWLDRLAGAVLVATEDGDVDSFPDLCEACRRVGDRWGHALVSLVGAVALLWRGRPAPEHFDRAATMFAELGASVFEAYSVAFGGLAALAAGDRDKAAAHGHRAAALAASHDIPGCVGIAALVLGRSGVAKEDQLRAKEVLGSLGTWDWYDRLSAPGSSGVVMEAKVLERPVVVLQCLGGFCLQFDGEPINEAAAKPMERALLHILAMRAGDPVHREALIEALWPEADPDAGLHRLQVAVSAVRRLLGAPNPGHELLVRDGDSYRLALPEGSEVDLWSFTENVSSAVLHRSADRADAEADCLTFALGAYRGTLLPADGPAEWVIDRRNELQGMAADAAVRLSRLRLGAGDAAAAAGAARIGVRIARFRDEAWRLLIDAAETAGHQAEAARARRDYASVVAELGVN